MAICSLGWMKVVSRSNDNDALIIAIATPVSMNNMLGLLVFHSPFSRVFALNMALISLLALE
jgi:hypothetical protein